jgi:hypothetical protein
VLAVVVVTAVVADAVVVVVVVEIAVDCVVTAVVVEDDVVVVFTELQEAKTIDVTRIPVSMIQMTPLFMQTSIVIL